MATAGQCWGDLKPHPVVGADWGTVGWWVVVKIAIDSGAATKPTGKQQATTYTHCDGKDPGERDKGWTSSESMHFVGLCVSVSVSLWVSVMCFAVLASGSYPRVSGSYVYVCMCLCACLCELGPCSCVLSICIHVWILYVRESVLSLLYWNMTVPASVTV